MEARVPSNAVGSRDLARRLGIDESRVRRLAARGRLPGRKVGHDWLFNVSLIDDEFARERHRGRPYSQRNALGLLFLASGLEPAWLEPNIRTRLTRRVVVPLVTLRPRLKSRAERRLYLAPDALRRRLAADPAFVLSGVSACERYKVDIVVRNVTEGYTDRSMIDRAEYHHALERVGEPEANLIVHVVPRLFLPTGRFMPHAVVGADLADSSDGRTKRAGHELLSRER